MTSKRDFERRQREEQEATAHAFQEFINTFQDYSGPPNKTFVKSGVLYGQESHFEKGQLYTPKPIVKQNPDTVKNAIECARLLKDTKLEKSKHGKPKSNLELLKEELKQRHQERDEKNKCKESLVSPYLMNYAEGGDPNSTNIFVANLNQKVTESDLMQLFGAFGPLASVKIMWPRNDEKSRNCNCGFVAYMSRKDAERALKHLKNRVDMRIGWGKAVELPTHPVYIPPELLKLSLPPPSSGLPFNAQMAKPLKKPVCAEDLDEILYKSTVRVTIPFDKKLLSVIHRMIEFVVREGPLFEAVIMNKEINNPAFKFLFDNKSPAHIYYRWKLYSILHGESQRYWSTKQFRMFKGSSIWTPPIIPNYFDGMPECLTNNIPETKKKFLSDAQKDRLIQYIQNMNTTRSKIAETMVFCLNHCEAYSDIIDIITDSFSNPLTKATKKIARLYLLSDILYNSEMKKRNSLEFRNEFEKNLVNIFGNLQDTYANLGVHDRDPFKVRVLKVLRSWDLWKLYPGEFLNKLENKLLGNDDDDSGVDEPLDGANLIKRSLKNKDNTDVICNVDSTKDSEEGVLMIPSPSSGFIPSKWESVDPDQLEAQAMSTQKYFDMEQQRHEKERQEKAKISEQEREKLRNIELMVMQYQVEIEMGKRKLKKGMSLDEGLDDYRAYLIQKFKKPAEEVSKSPSRSEDDFRKKNAKRGAKDKRKNQKRGHAR